jgi:hypothetical protein
MRCDEVVARISLPTVRVLAKVGARNGSSKSKGCEPCRQLDVL